MAPELSSSLVFNVRRFEPELVAPAKPTPREYKLLSDIDGQESLRFQLPVIQFYRYNPSMQGKDPAKLIKEAVAQTLVFYYPLAGRLREGPNRKLMVDCNGEGALFIEADADVILEKFGDALQPPFPCIDDLLYDVPGSKGMLNCPLLLIQVTRLRCGGFIVATRVNHLITDGLGLAQFMSAMVEIAHGAVAPSIQPVWERHLLDARDPPRVTCTHREYDEVEEADTFKITPLENMVHRSFYFGPKEVSALRSLLPPHLRQCSKFELITACVWRCRTIVTNLDPDEEVRMIFPVSVRSKLNPSLPSGFYGNAFVLPAAITTARKLSQNPLGYAVELVKQAKESVTEEYVKSVADLMVIRDRPHFTASNSYFMSNVSRAGFMDIDFGWGKAVYAGPAKAGVGTIPGVLGILTSIKNKKGEFGMVMPMCLPATSMERFAKELDFLLNEQPFEVWKESIFIRSYL
ncbi:hypothetical protein CRYUN_Cryun09bG0220500 [Craigia yunnanensis]